MNMQELTPAWTCHVTGCMSTRGRENTRRSMCCYRRIETMWVIEVLSMSTHEGITQTIECLGRLLTPWRWGFYAWGAVVDSNDWRNLLLDWPLEERGTSQSAYISAWAPQHCWSHCNALRGWHWEVGSQVPIHKITRISLKVIVLLIGWITRSVALHHDSLAYMYCVVKRLKSWVFEWSMTMLDFMKRHLTECWGWSNKNSGLGILLCSFFFERVPSLSPWDTVRGHMASFPAVCKWGAFLPR